MALDERPQVASVETASTVRRIPLHRRVCIIRTDRIAVRPSRSAMLVPLAGLVLCALLLTTIALFRDSLPFAILAFLLLVSMLLLPFSGMGFVYSLIGSSVIFDRRKQSGVWQQGLMGLGIGTQELVPFWKIEELIVQEAGHDAEAEGEWPLEEFAQWEIVLVKTSGKQLVVGGVTVARSQAEEGQQIAVQVAQAIAQLTEKPLRIEEPEMVDDEDWEDDYDEKGEAAL